MPLLQDGQDPDGLAARVAYHLHRNGIDDRDLAITGMPQSMARAIRQGTLALSAQDVTRLATELQLDPNDLIMPLTEEQEEEWRFYRLSARNVVEVWRRVAESCTAHRMSQRQLSAILGIPQSMISRVTRGERGGPVLTWPDAAKLSSAFGLADGPDAFLPPGITLWREEERGR